MPKDKKPNRASSGSARFRPAATAHEGSKTLGGIQGVVDKRPVTKPKGRPGIARG